MGSVFRFPGDSILCQVLDPRLMKLTPRMLQLFYELLAGMGPFTKYKLPKSVDVAFKVNHSKMLMGVYDVDPHTITLSSVMHKSLNDALQTMAHEMCHLALEKQGASDHADHDSEFNALAAKVCDAWGWKFKEF